MKRIWTHHNPRTEEIWIQSRTQCANKLPSSKTVDCQFVQGTESQKGNSKLHCPDKALISGADSGFWWQRWGTKRWILLSLFTSRKTCINCFQHVLSKVLHAPHLHITTSFRLGPSESDTFCLEFWWSISFHPGEGFQEFLAQGNFPNRDLMISTLSL